jgi:hypothetical protein
VTFDESTARLRGILKEIDEADDHTQIPESERVTFYTNLPTRGYNAEEPTFEMLDHAALSGAPRFSKILKE